MLSRQIVNALNNKKKKKKRRKGKKEKNMYLLGFVSNQ